MRAPRPIDLDSADIWSGSQQRNWLFVGLLLSLLLHSALCVYFYRARFQPAAAIIDSRQTPTFKVKNVDLDPKPLDKASIDQMNPAAKPNPDNTDVQLPDERKSFDKLLQDVHASAAMPDDTRDVLPDQPKVEQTDVNSVINEIERTTAQTLAKNPNATREQSLLTDSSACGRPQPALTGTELATSTTIKRPNTFTSKIPGDSAGPKRGTPGFQRSGFFARAERSARVGHDDSHAGRSAFRIRQRGFAGERGRAIAETGDADQTQSERDLHDRGLHRFVRTVRIQSRSEPASRGQRKGYLVEVMGINPAQIQDTGLRRDEVSGDATADPGSRNGTDRDSPAATESARGDRRAHAGVVGCVLVATLSHPERSRGIPWRRL